MLIKVCQRCGRVIAYGSACPDCKPAPYDRAASDRRYNAKRDRKYLNFYKCKAWRTMSARKLAAAKHRCEREGCRAIATEVHHRVPIQTEAGWAKRYEWANLEALCIRCHNREHRRF